MSKELPSPKIGKIVSIINKWNPALSGHTDPFYYIDLSSVDQEEKRIVGAATIYPKEAPSRARQLVQEGDILVSTVRPNLNGVAYVPRELDGATASTGFCVLRPKQDNLDGRYLYHWVQYPRFIGEMVKLATGASYPAVSDRIVKDSKIPLPPLPEQKRIAAILDKADAIRRKRQQAIKLADDFLRATFLDMFGDPVTNPKGWEIRRLGDLTIKIGSGATPRGGKSSYVTQGISLIRSLNIHDDKFLHKELAHITAKQADGLGNVVVEDTDVLLNITGASVCRCAIVPNDVLPARVNQHVCIVRPKKSILTSQYLLHCLISKSYKQKLLSIAGGGGATREALTKQQVEKFEIPLPQVALQNKFTLIKNCLLNIKNKQLDFFGQPLFNSFTQRAFRGEL